MTRLPTKFAAAATLAAMTLATPAFAKCELPCKTSKGKMANEWTVSSIKAPDAQAPVVTKKLLGGGGGAGKVNVQDISINGGGNDFEKPRRSIFLKLGAIKGESQD